MAGFGFALSGVGLGLVRGVHGACWVEQGLHLWRQAMGAMCRGSCVKDRAYVHVQLESLILAQNERWRQA